MQARRRMSRPRGKVQRALAARGILDRAGGVAACDTVPEACVVSVCVQGVSTGAKI
jgi:hypothetical protein